jgi:D-alanyl-D-alanine dipeptidase
MHTCDLDILETLPLLPLRSGCQLVTDSPIDPSDPLIPLDPAPGLELRPVYSLNHLAGSDGVLRVRTEVALRLRRAAELLPDGISLVVLDAWRSAELQRSLYAQIKDPKYAFDLDVSPSAVSYPTEDAPHRTGGAVDVTLADRLGAPWPMGGDFDEPSDRSRTAALESINPQGAAGRAALLGRRLLYHVMITAGFSNYDQEWWHYDFGNAFWRHFGKLPQGPIYRTVTE